MSGDGQAYGDKPASDSSFSRLTTRAVEPRERLDYWRQLFVASYLDRPACAKAGDFHGELLRSGSHEGVTFVNLRADPILCDFGKRDSDLILLGYIRSGHMNLRHGHGETTALGPDSGLVLFDCDRPIFTSSTQHDMSYLVLQRSLVVAAMDGDPTPRGAALRRLPGDGLAPVLRACLGAITEHGAHLDAVEVQAAVRAAGSLAVTLLAGSQRRRRVQAETLDDALFAAARQQIQLNAGNPGLTADHVAAGLGCSRSHLYRLFARHSQTVAGYLRELRLRQARMLLETLLTEPIGMVALRCGYTDLSAFGKAFRRQFGMTPTECRDIARFKPPLP